jgi:hypothetical protein
MLRSTFHLPLAVLASGVICIASTASAYVPGWAHWWRGTVIDVEGCAAQAATAVHQATGSPATTLQLDNNTYLVRGFTSNAGVFVHCMASPQNICPGRPKADLSILAFSSISSQNAASLRDLVNTKFGNPVLIDCGP